jgi:hypothetical protein
MAFAPFQVINPTDSLSLVRSPIRHPGVRTHGSTAFSFPRSIFCRRSRTASSLSLGPLTMSPRPRGFVGMPRGMLRSLYSVTALIA